MQALVVLHDGEVGLDDLRAGGHQIVAHALPQGHHRVAGVDRVGAAGVAVDVEAGYREPETAQRQRG